MSPKHRIWTVPRVLVSFVMFALLAVSVGALSSCSDEEEKKPTGSKRKKTTSSKKDSGSSALTSLKKEVGKLVQQAKKLDVESYDGKSYESARKYFAKAKDLASDDDTPGAIRAYKQAQRHLKKGISNTEKISASLGRLDELFEEVEEL